MPGLVYGMSLFWNSWCQGHKSYERPTKRGCHNLKKSCGADGERCTAGIGDINIGYSLPAMSGTFSAFVRLMKDCDAPPKKSLFVE